MAILLGIDEGKGGRGALMEEDTPACLLGQGTGKGIPVGETPETLLEQLNKLIDVEGLAYFSQYLNRQINKGLTPFSLFAWEDGFDLGPSLELADSTQLAIKLKLKDLQKDFLNIVFVHGMVLPKG
jgi:hypothetical protein